MDSPLFSEIGKNLGRFHDFFWGKKTIDIGGQPLLFELLLGEKKLKIEGSGIHRVWKGFSQREENKYPIFWDFIPGGFRVKWKGLQWDLAVLSANFSKKEQVIYLKQLQSPQPGEGISFFGKIALKLFPFLFSNISGARIRGVETSFIDPFLKLNFKTHPISKMTLKELGENFNWPGEIKKGIEFLCFEKDYPLFDLFQVNGINLNPEWVEIGWEFIPPSPPPVLTNE